MEKKYNIIYVDPPWKYEKHKGRGVAEGHYRTMGVQEICRLPVSSITEKDAALFLWVTFPQMPEAFKVMEAWGFSYRTVAFAWVKQNKSGNGYFFGMGNWTRSNAEICLLGVKGHPRRVSNKVPQLIVSPLGRHSEKPGKAGRRIVELMGGIPRLELFARQETPGWDVWGDEVIRSPAAGKRRKGGSGSWRCIKLPVFSSVKLLWHMYRCRKTLRKLKAK